MAKPEKKVKTVSEKAVPEKTEFAISINPSITDEITNIDNINNNINNNFNDTLTNVSLKDDFNSFSVSTVNNPAYEPMVLMDMIAKLQKQVEDLTREREEVKEEKVSQQPSPQIAIPVPVPVNNDKDTSTKLLEYLTSKKSDREVIIIHNQEMNESLSTSIELTGLHIDFHTMGEQRVLSWQQFEECVSKYRKWFDKKIILVSADDRDLAERYGVSYQGQDGNVVLDKTTLARVGKLNIKELEIFFNKLCKEDQNNLCSYWIGKCYSRDPDFYDRYKIEILRRLSDCGVFDNIMVNMNNEFMRRKESNNVKDNTPVKQIPRINAQM